MRARFRLQMAFEDGSWTALSLILSGRKEIAELQGSAISE